MMGFDNYFSFKVVFLALLFVLSSFALPSPQSNSASNSEPLSDLAQQEQNAEPEPALHSSAKLPVEELIMTCSVENTIALTFDDGPSDNTAWVVDQLRGTDIKATFFLNAYKWNDFVNEETTALLKEIINEGHQIAHHTFTHNNLPDNPDGRDGVIREMRDLDAAFFQNLGYAPTYMRPPFLALNDEVLDTLWELKYHVIMVDGDTNDWRFDKEESAHIPVEIFRNAVENGRRMILAHDKHKYTTPLLVPAMIEEVKQRGLRGVTVGQCLGEPQENWYRKPESEAEMQKSRRKPTDKHVIP